MNKQLQQLLEKLCDYLKEHGHHYCTPEMVYEQLHRCFPTFKEFCDDECEFFSWIMLAAGVGKPYDEIIVDIRELME